MDEEDGDELATIASLLGDECVRTILVASAAEPMAAEALIERCDASRATVYRRLGALTEHSLLDKRTMLDSDGHHHEVYAANLDQVTIDLTEEGFGLRVERRESMSDRFTRLLGEW